MPYLSIVPRHYELPTFYDHLIELFEQMTSPAMIAARLRSGAPATVRLMQFLHTLAQRRGIVELRQIRRLLVKDRKFRAFHEGRSNQLPEFYEWRFDRALGPYAALIAGAERIPLPNGVARPFAGKPNAEPTPPRARPTTRTDGAADGSSPAL
jgi:CRP-like cAMP-binding protein